MNTALFNRKWAVTFTPPGASKSVRYDQLRVAFEIEKLSESTSQKAKIQVYNLNSVSRTIFRAGTQVRLEAGYGTQEGDTVLGTIYNGDIPSGPKGGISERKGADVVTTFECGAAERSITWSVFNKAYPPGTVITQLIQDLAAALGVPVGNVKGLSYKVYTGQGIVLSGPVARSLDRLLRGQNLIWSIQSGALQIYPIGKSYTTQAIVLSSGAGVVPSPVAPGSEVARRAQQNTGLIGVPSKSDKVLTFDALLNPGLQPGCLVQIISEQVFGFYSILTAKFMGDSHGDRWTVKCQAIETTAQEIPQQNFGGTIAISRTEAIV